MAEALRVYTTQGVDLRDFAGPIRLELGKYRDRQEIQKCQRNLYEILRTDQVVWCSQSPPDYLSGEVGRYLHKLEILPSEIVAVVDALAWNHLIGSGADYILPVDEQKLRMKAAMLADPDQAYRHLKQKLLKKRLPADLWSGVLRDRIKHESDQLLLRFPLRLSAIVEVMEVTKELSVQAQSRRFRWEALR